MFKVIYFVFVIVRVSIVYKKCSTTCNEILAIGDGRLPVLTLNPRGRFSVNLTSVWSFNFDSVFGNRPHR